MSNRLLYYTRQPMDDEIYGRKLADSVHFALQKDDGPFVPLNHNSGILFVKATHNADGTMTARSLKEPRMIRREDGSYAVAAFRYNAGSYFDSTSQHSDDGSVALSASAGNGVSLTTTVSVNTAEGEASRLTEYILFTTKDLIHFTEEGPMTLGEWRSFKTIFEFQTENAGITLSIPYGSSLPEGAQICGCLEISDEEALRLINRFLTPINTANTVPATVEASSEAEVKAIKALASYSDGSSLYRPVDWNTDDIDFPSPVLIP